MLDKTFLRLQPWLGPILCPLSVIYRLCMHLRAKLYAYNLLKSWPPTCPLISVGNISWGGSGKTPLCTWLLDWALSRHNKPALISRGYKASPPAYPHLVKPWDDAHKSGDEPLMLSSSCPEADIIIDPERKRAAKWAAQNLAPDLFILDDGFQHLKVKRDIDLVLIRPQDLNKDWNRVIPLGSWREGKTALKRASAFLINVDPDKFNELEKKLKRRLSIFSRPIFSFYLDIRSLIRVKDEVQLPLAHAGDYMLVTAVGDPAKVINSTQKALSHAPLKQLI